MNKRIIALIVVAALIIGAIYYLESQKVRPIFVADEIITEPEIIDNESESIAAETVPEISTKNTFLPTEVYVPDKKKIADNPDSIAPELQGISGYINADQFKLEELRGKVILIDFWTYSCINCIRTQPYLNAWYKAYADDGLVIVGVHTPEFEFEKNYDNVQKAVEDGELKYPVVQDNAYQTWTAYRNRFWPRKYLIDIDGIVRYDHIGEGAYDDTERVIQQLLAERSDKLGMVMNITSSELFGSIDVDSLSARTVGTPEIYFGYKFSRGNLGSPEGLNPESITIYAEPDEIVPNKAYLVGSWHNTADYSELVEGTGKVILNYSATSVNIVASSEPAVELNLTLDGLRIAPAFVGADNTTISEEKLYNIVSTLFKETHMLEIKVDQPGFRIYTFTFG